MNITKIFHLYNRRLDYDRISLKYKLHFHYFSQFSNIGLQYFDLIFSQNLIIYSFPHLALKN